MVGLHPAVLKAEHVGIEKDDGSKERESDVPRKIATETVAEHVPWHLAGVTIAIALKIELVQKDDQLVLQKREYLRIHKTLCSDLGSFKCEPNYLCRTHVLVQTLLWYLISCWRPSRRHHMQLCISRG